MTARNPKLAGCVVGQWGQALDCRFQEGGSTWGSAIFHSEGIAGRISLP